MRFLFVLMICFPNILFAEMLVFKNCKSEDYDFEKNDYKLDLNKGQMIREFTYTDETYERLRLNDMRVEKENTSTKGISKENGEIISEISDIISPFSFVIPFIEVFSFSTRISFNLSRS